MMVLIRAMMSLRSHSRVYLSCPFVILALAIKVKGCKNRKDILPYQTPRIGTKICSKFLKSSRYEYISYSHNNFICI